MGYDAVNSLHGDDVSEKKASGYENRARAAVTENWRLVFDHKSKTTFLETRKYDAMGTSYWSLVKEWSGSNLMQTDDPDLAFVEIAKALAPEPGAAHPEPEPKFEKVKPADPEDDGWPDFDADAEPEPEPSTR